MLGQRGGLTMFVGTRQPGARWRRLAFPCLIVAMVIPVYSQSGRSAGTIVADGAPVLLLPDPSRPPLTKLAAGTAVRVIGTEGEWLNIEFQDDRFGPRVGYVLKAHVKIAEQTAAGETAQAAARKLAETNSSKPNGVPPPSVSCHRIDCIPAKDLMNTRPPLLVNPRISATAERRDR